MNTFKRTMRNILGRRSSVSRLTAILLVTALLSAFLLLDVNNRFSVLSVPATLSILLLNFLLLLVFWRSSRSTTPTMYHILTVLVLLLMGITLATKLHLKYKLSQAEENWSQFSRLSLQKDTETIRNEFFKFLKSTETLGQHVAADVSLQQALIDPNIENRARLFQILLQTKPDFREDFGIETFDGNMESVSWTGSILPPYGWTRQHAFSDTAAVYIIGGQIYTLLCVAQPIHDESSQQKLGTVVVYRPLKVNVSLQSPFLGESSFAHEVSSVVRSPFRLEFLSSGRNHSDSNTWLPAADEEVSVVLPDFDSRTLGVARFTAPTYQGFVLSETETAARLSSLFLTVILMIFLVLLLHALRNQVLQVLSLQQHHPQLRPIVLFLEITFFLWLARYGLLLLQFPQGLIHSSLFDPVHYASSFLFGLSRSPGDLSVTLIFLISTVYIAWRLFTVPDRTIVESVRGKSIRAIVLLPVLLCIHFLFDAYVSSVRSLVQDSTLSFFRYLDLFSSAPLALTILNLFLLSCSFVLFALLIIYGTHRFLQPALPSSSLRLGIFCAAYTCIGVFWSFLSQNQSYAFEKVLFLVILVFFTFWIDRSIHQRSFHRLTFSVLFTVACAFLSFPIFHDEVMKEEDHLIRLRTTEALEPEENLIRIMIETGLAYFRLNDTVREALLDEDMTSTQNVAFVEWIKSPLSQFNLGSSILILDAQGRAMSHFSIESAYDVTRAYVAYIEEIEESEGTFITLSHSRIDGEEIDVYTGAVPILSEEELIGAVVLTIPVVKSPLRVLAKLEGIDQTPTRPIHVGKVFTHPYGPVRIVISTYEREVLVESTDPDVVRGYRPSEWILEAIFDHKENYVRAEETIGGKDFVNFYFPQKGGGKVLGMVSVGYERIGTLTVIYNFLRLLFIYLLFSIIIVFIASIVRAVARGEIRRLIVIKRFQNKLIFSFTLVIIFPMLFMAFFGRHIILSQQEEWIQSQIEKDLQLARTLIEEETITSAQKIASSSKMLKILNSRGVSDLDSTDYDPAIVTVLGTEGDVRWRNGSRHVEYERRGQLQSILSPRLLYSHSPDLRVGVIAPIFDQDDGNGPIGFIEYFRPIDDALCRNISRRIGRDITVYHRGEEMASNRPEVFQSELITKRLPGDAVLSIELHEQKYYYRKRYMGERPYIEGYIPLVDQIGKTSGVLSVPTIYQQRRLEQETARTISIILVLYALIFCITLVIGFILSRRISSPVKELTEGTRHIATGDLDFRIKMNAKDELGDLVASFNKMTTDLRASQNHLIQAEKDAAWREMARQVAHEVKNPLTPMKLSIQHLMKAYTDRAQHFDTILSETVNMVSEQIEVLRNIASEFSSFARLPRRKVQSGNINDILQSSIRLFADSLEDIRLVTEYDASMPTIQIDPEEMQRVFVNLIQNGLQAMPEGGTLRLKSEFRNGVSEDGQHAEIVVEITDTGCGIPEEMRGMLFEPSFSTKTEGTGLGLAICKRVIDDMGGCIEIDSEVERGTTVRIRFPADTQR